jgi:hypothetical protein
MRSQSGNAADAEHPEDKGHEKRINAHGEPGLLAVRPFSVPQAAARPVVFVRPRCRRHGRRRLSRLRDGRGSDHGFEVRRAVDHLVGQRGLRPAHRVFRRGGHRARFDASRRSSSRHSAPWGGGAPSRPSGEHALRNRRHEGSSRWNVVRRRRTHHADSRPREQDDALPRLPDGAHMGICATGGREERRGRLVMVSLSFDAGQALAVGSSTRTAVPTPSTLVTSMEPPCASTILLASVSPSPTPPVPRDRLLSPRKKGTKT